MGRLGEIQLSMFPSVPHLSVEPETLELLRPHKWAHGEATELPLVSIELAPHEGRWMWHSNLNSRCGAAQGARALPQWKKFANSKQEALLAGIKDVQAFMHRATEPEQQRILEWLREQASRIAA
ncbi:hypothetical protein NPS53_08955 [Pseudomonas putida]|uniref:hypothetical protein n=1 Tax=Pseudomonas putida TaxID=303 RepID=UPI002363D50C|nr:hypothetical protein [Pseudomonas putida]MDD2139703.1 hypothetical protein [Pseudomonas putida]HDS1721627.1 hypothetical protein [Pseudomonas putida]